MDDKQRTLWLGYTLGNVPASFRASLRAIAKAEEMAEERRHRESISPNFEWVPHDGGIENLSISVSEIHAQLGLLDNDTTRQGGSDD
jgi:hypothetical protein